MGTLNGSVVLSTLEFDMLWEVERLPSRHSALDVPSPGVTHTERHGLLDEAWASLTRRDLARRGRASGELVDMLNLFANPKVSVDVWVWAEREIKGLAVSVGSQGMLGVVDGDEVWLIPARDSSLAEAAVSVLGELGAGVGHSVSVPHEVLVAADADARGDPQALVTALQDRGVELWHAQELAGMFVGVLARGQLGVQRLGRDGQQHRNNRVAAFYDTDAGRYLFQLEQGADGRNWGTVTPTDNGVLANRVLELLDEL